MDGELVVLAENRLINTKEDVADIVEQINQLENLVALKLSGNSYSEKAAEAIGNALTKHNLLQRALWSDMFVSRLKTEIPQALTCLSNGLITSGAHLVELDLSDNAFGPTGIEGIKTLLTSQVCYSIQILKFNNNGLGIGGGKILSRALLECHQEAADSGNRFALQVFEAGRNRLENEGAMALAEVFEIIGTLVEISLPQNGIYHDGISALAKALGKNKDLQILNLSDNTLTEKGCLAIAEVLGDLQNLKIINFDDCLVQSDGAKALASTLQDGHQLLEELHLNFNELDTESAVEVAIAMNNKQELKLLNLNGNMFGETGIEIIKETMESKGQLDILGSLSDDEGEEDENEDEDEGSEPEEKDPTSVITNGHSLEVTINNSFSFNNPVNNNRLDELRVQLGNHPSPEIVSEIFVEATASYSNTVSTNNNVHNFIDECCHPLCESGEINYFINQLLVQTGLIKSEDKKFKPIDQIEGPLLALLYLVRQHYFPKDSRDILITFVSRSNTALDSNIDLRHKLLTSLHNT